MFITISSLASVSWRGEVSKRKIELNWTPPVDAQPGDWVGLFRRNPNISGLSRILVRLNASRHGGYFKTDVSFPNNPLLGLRSPRATCLYGLYIAYIRNERTLKMNCMRLRPKWMWEYRSQIGDMPLHALMLPGTHNSGSYEEFEVLLL